MAETKILDRIAKLLEMATHEGSDPNEAALAASMAQELMVKHAVEEADLASHGGPGGSLAEPVESVPMNGGERGKRVPRWEASLAHVMCRSFFCRTYTVPGSDIYVVGRKSDREVFMATFNYIRGELKRMATVAFIKYEREFMAGLNPGEFFGYKPQPEHGKTWKNGFYLGACTTIRDRMADAVKKLKEADLSGTTAIVLVNRQEAVEKYIKSNLKLRSGARTSFRSRDGFEEGKKAGHAVDLSGRATKSLGA